MRKVSDKFIFFDLDGTLCNIFEDPNWLSRIEKEDVSLFVEAKPMVKIKEFTSLIKLLQEKGYKVGIISYLPWYASSKYSSEVKKAKEDYIKNRFNKIKFDKIHIVPYPTPKDIFADHGDCLIDDDINNRKQWSKGKAYTQNDIVNKLKRIYKL